MDPIESIDSEIEQKLQTYYAGSYGKPRSSDDMWQAISSRLGEQESEASAGFARSLNGLYGKEDRAVESARAIPQQKASKIQIRRKTRWGYWNPAMAATLVLVLGSVLVGLLAVVSGTISGKVGPNVLPNPGFEDGLGNWTVTNGNTNVQEYGGGIDRTVAHSGEASAYISLTVGSPSNLGSLVTSIDPGSLRGERARFSAFVKTEGEGTWTTLNMVVTGKLPPELLDPQHSFKTSGEANLALDNMSDRPILGTTDWTEYDLVLDVPADATKITVAISFAGVGRAWLDDVQLTAVGENVPSTDIYRNSQPVNGGFENGLTGWMPGTFQPFRLTTDTSVYHGGKASGYIDDSATSPQSHRYVDVHQVINTANFKGKRIRFSAYLKTQDVLDHALLWISVQDISGLQVSRGEIGENQIQGTIDWRKYQVEVDVPENGRDIYFAVGMYGKGKLWVDDVQLEGVGDLTPTPTK